MLRSQALQFLKRALLPQRPRMTMVNFELAVTGSNVTLNVSSIGYAPKEIEVPSGSNTVNLSLDIDTRQLGEVVVTALGVARNKRTLSYTTESVDPKAMTKAQEVNTVNALAGKVAGLDIVQSSTGITSSARMVGRGDRSFTGSSEMLVIVDGIRGSLASLNSFDIASMNVLKSANAAALYGSEGQNGAIIISTKKGEAGKALAISVNSNAQIQQAVQLRDLQQVYAQGAEGNYIRSSETAWGPAMTGQTVRHWSADP